MNLSPSEEKELLRLLMKEQETRRRERARNKFLSFVTYTNPAYHVNWHHRVICGVLDDFVAGSIKNLMVFMPPQHGKSELVSRNLPAYILGRYPDAKITAASYAAGLIQSMNRDVQRIIDSDRYHTLFPGTRLNTKNIRTVAGSYLRNNDIFEVVDRRGAYRCAGVGGGLTGFPSDWGIIDDPFKDYKESVSPTVRNAVWEWYTSVFLSRTHVNTRKLLTLTRWNPDDLAGRLIESEGDKWTILKLPAICEDPDAPYEQREPGEALWPERFPAEMLLERRQLNVHQFESLYQQNPRPREGGMFQRTMFTENTVPEVPIEAKRVRRWDIASTEGSGDWTVGVLMARLNGIYYVEDVVRFRYGSAKRDKMIREIAQRDADKYGSLNVKIGVPQDSKDLALHLTTLLDGFSVYVEREQGSKEDRADPFASQAGAGNVKMKKAPWNEEFMAELEVFPGGHDDQVDAAAGAYNKLAQGGEPKEKVGVWFG